MAGEGGRVSEYPLAVFLVGVACGVSIAFLFGVARGMYDELRRRRRSSGVIYPIKWRRRR